MKIHIEPLFKDPFFFNFRRVSFSDDLADDLGDVDFEDPGNTGDDEGWETEDEMEAEEEQDDSDLTFSKHSGSGSPSWMKMSSRSRLQSKLSFSCCVSVQVLFFV